MHQQQTSSAPAPHPNNPPSSLKRSPATATTPGALSLAPLSSSSSAAAAAALAPVQHPHDAVGPALPPFATTLSSSLTGMARVRLSDIAPYDGAPAMPYLRAVETLSGSLTRHNAAVIELGAEDAALMRCGLESARLYLRTRSQAHGAGKGSPRGVFLYKAGSGMEDGDSSPPCMAEIFKCMGKVARAALCAIARHLRLRSDVFTHLLDDIPLPANGVSSSVLALSHSSTMLQNGKGATGVGKPSVSGEVEKGLLTLISSDSPGLQVCDPNGRWYLADGGSSPGDLLLVTGKALSHATAGLRPAALHRAAPDYFTRSSSVGRTSLAFRLMPQSNAILDCSPIAAAGHVIPQSYVPVSVSQFMDDFSPEEDTLCHNPDNACVAGNNLNMERPTLRSVLSDPLSGAFLEDAVVVSCGHSFGGFMLKRVIETSRCTLCGAEIEGNSLIPNHALRAAAAAIKLEDDRRLFHNAALRKRRKEISDHNDPRRLNRENGDSGTDNGLHKGVQYPFTVNEKVLIKGNKRTPEKFVGKEAVITSQCLNGWYLLKIMGSGENVRLQYRSLQKIQNSQSIDDRCPPQVQGGT